MEIAIFIAFLLILRVIIPNSKIYKVLLSIILLIIALPAGFALEISANGCCGAPSTGREGIGYALTAVLFTIGLTLLILTLTTSKK